MRPWFFASMVGVVLAAACGQSTASKEEDKTAAASAERQSGTRQDTPKRRLPVGKGFFKAAASASSRLFTKGHGSATPSADASASPAASPSASAAAAAPAIPASDALGDAFGGSPDPAIALENHQKLAGLTMSFPKSWDAGGGLYDGMITGRTKNGHVKTVLYDNGSPANATNVTFWLRAPASVPDAKWQDGKPFDLGRTPLPGTLAKGTGKMAKEDVDLTYFLVKGTGVFLATVATKTATEQERAELVAVVRSLGK